MFNFFNKINEGSKDDCYLIKSGVFDANILNDDKLESYNQPLNDKDIPQHFKDLIKNFLVPYKISVLKFMLNKEYYESPYPVDYEHNHKQIAPSLKKIKENNYSAMGYPSWFYVAFPDVALWVMKGEGIKLIENRFKNLSESELTDGTYIRANLLNEIIKLYQNKTNKPLECKKY